MPDGELKVPGLTRGDTEQLRKNKEYLASLRKVLKAQVELGNLDDTTGKSIYESWNKQLTTSRGVGMWRGFAPIPKEAPYYKDILSRNAFDLSMWLGDLQKDVVSYKQKQTQTFAKTEAAKREYLPALEQYLQYSEGKEWITPEQHKDILSGEQSQLEQGVNPDYLSNFQNVQNFLQSQQQTQEEQKQSWLQNKGAMEGVTDVQKKIADWQDIGVGRHGNLPSAGDLEIMKWNRLSNDWEAQKENALQSMGNEPYYWIKKWQIEHAKNPYLTGTALEERDLAAAARGQTYTLGEQARLKEWAEAQQAPPTPSWLTKLQPMLQAGKPITQLPLNAPSMQIWNKIMPSEQEQYAGYVNYAGGNLNDLLTQTRMMLPQTPVGAGNVSWRPAYQRVGR